MTIRNATPAEAAELEALQRRSSDIWEQYREQLAAHPDAIELPQTFIHNGWVRVAVSDDDVPVGFAVVIPGDGATLELDGLFVEPRHLRRGIGRLLIDDAVARAAARGSRRLEVTAGPAQGFYERTGFKVIGSTQTRFGPAVRMRRDIDPEPPRARTHDYADQRLERTLQTWRDSLRRGLMRFLRPMTGGARFGRCVTTSGS